MTRRQLAAALYLVDQLPWSPFRAELEWWLLSALRAASTDERRTACAK